MFMSTIFDPARYAQNVSKAHNSIAQNAVRMTNRWTNRRKLQLENLQSAMISLSTSPADMPKVWRQLWDDACDCAAEDVRDTLDFTSATVRQMGDANVTALRPLLENVSPEKELPLAKPVAKGTGVPRQEQRIAAE